MLLLRSTRGVTLGTPWCAAPKWSPRSARFPASVRCAPAPWGAGRPRGRALARLPGSGQAARSLPAATRPPDRLTANLSKDRLGPFSVRLDKGRVEGAWCPGFSDLAIDGRKFARLGMRLSAGWPRPGRGGGQPSQPGRAAQPRPLPQGLWTGCRCGPANQPGRDRRPGGDGPAGSHPAPRQLPAGACEDVGVTPSKAPLRLVLAPPTCVEDDAAGDRRED